MANRMTYTQAQHIKAYASLYPDMLINQQSKIEADWILFHFHTADDYEAFVQFEAQMETEEQARRKAEDVRRREALRQLLVIDTCKRCGLELEDCACWNWAELL